MNILITGEKGYIGTNLISFMKNKKTIEGIPHSDHIFKTINLRNDEWKMIDFTSMECIVHLAALVHMKNQQDTDYYRINRDLSFELAKKAKDSGVKHFVFLSTMGVYDLSNKDIDLNTPVNPKTPYAASKLQAEKLINSLADENFKVSVIRCPFVYGKKCKGNYQLLKKLSDFSVVFPDTANERSMIYIENLSFFFKRIIEEKIYGTLFPQNEHYVNTAEMVREIRKAHGKRTILFKQINPMIKAFSNNSELVSKVFSDFRYSKSLPGGPEIMDYNLVKFEETIIRSEI